MTDRTELRPAETVSESAPTRHEAPDVAELRRLAEVATPGPWWREWVDGDDWWAVYGQPTGARDNARAEVERLTAKVERVRDWLDRRGVDVSDRDGAYMDGYRAAQRHAPQDAAELRRTLDGGAES